MPLPTLNADHAPADRDRARLRIGTALSTLSREVLAAAGLHPKMALLVSKPPMERRSFATARKLWPDVEITSEPLEFDDYLKSIGDKLVLDMLVGDLQRVIEYPRLGFAIA